MSQTFEWPNLIATSWVTTLFSSNPSASFARIATNWGVAVPRRHGGYRLRRAGAAPHGAEGGAPRLGAGGR